MKTAISLPDQLFQRAETTAKRLRVSRSQLYAEALADFLARHDADVITTQLNDVYSRERSELDPVLERAQFDLAKRSRW